MGTGDGARVAKLRFLSAKRALAELRSVTNQTSIGFRSPPVLRGLACDPLDYNRACPAFPQELNKHRVPELRTNKLVRTTHANACSPRTKLPRRPLRDVLGVSFFTPRISHTFELDPGAESMKEESFERWRDCGRTCKVEASRGTDPLCLGRARPSCLRLFTPGPRICRRETGGISVSGLERRWRESSSRLQQNVWS
jgi:hypothetical protein